MSITGRDITERTLILEMDWGRYRWTVLGEEHEVSERKDELEFSNDPLVKTIQFRLDEAEELLLDDPEATTATWSCTSAELLDEVERLYGPQDTSPTGIGMRVKRLTQRLESQLGISYTKDASHRKGRNHTFTREII